MRVAELVCHKCGTVSYFAGPTSRNSTMPLCECGGIKQVVRVVTKRTPSIVHPRASSESPQKAALS
jgi:hypothetical protein